MYNIGDKFEIEVSNILNGDEYTFDGLKIILSEDELNRLKRIIDEDDKPDMVRTLYNCFITFMNTNWNNRHAILKDNRSNDVAEMLAKCGDPYEFINKVTSYYKDIKPGDIVESISVGNKYLVIGNEDANNLTVIAFDSENYNLKTYVLNKSNVRKIGSYPTICGNIIMVLTNDK